MSIAFLEPVVRVREAASAPHWVTLHAHDSEEGTIHVQIGGGGRVLAGPKSLIGAHMGALASHPSVKSAEHHPPGHEPPGAKSHPQYTEHQPPEKPAPLPGKPYARLHGAPQTRQEQPKEGPEPLTREQTHAGLQTAREQAKAARGAVDEHTVAGYVNNVADRKRSQAAATLERDLAAGRALRVPGGIANAATTRAIIARLRGQERPAAVGGRPPVRTTAAAPHAPPAIQRSAEENARRQREVDAYNRGEAGPANPIAMRYDAASEFPYVLTRARDGQEVGRHRDQFSALQEIARLKTNAPLHGWATGERPAAPLRAEPPSTPEAKAADTAVAHQQAQADLAAYRSSKDRNPNPWAPHLSPPVNDAKDRELQEKATRAQLAHQSVQAQQQQVAAVQQQEGQRAHEREMVRLKADVAPKPAITPLQAPPQPTPLATGQPGEITKERIQAKVAAGEHLTREEKGYVLNGYRMPKPKPEEPTTPATPTEQPKAEAKGKPALTTPQKPAAKPAEAPASHRSFADIHADMERARARRSGAPSVDHPDFVEGNKDVGRYHREYLKASDAARQTPEVVRIRDRMAEIDKRLHQLPSGFSHGMNAARRHLEAEDRDLRRDYMRRVGRLPGEEGAFVHHYVTHVAGEQAPTAPAEQPKAEATPALVAPRKVTPQPEPAGHDATLTRDRQTGRAWLDFGGQKPPQEHSDALKREGWRYSGYRQQWHNPRKYVQPPAGIRAHDAGHNDYSGERAERNEERAGKVRAEAHGQLQKAHDIGSMIPMGQPILVGHHSEGRHRRDIQRIDRAMGKGVEGLRHAEHLERRAESSRQTREDPGVVQRRIQRLEADKRSITQGVNRWPEGPARDARIKQIDDEMGAHRQRLEEMGGSGQELDYKPGDFVRSKGGSFRVEHVGPKNVKLTDLGPSGFVLTHDKSHVKEILKRGHEVSPEEHARITARIPFESERKRAYNPHKDERRRVRESASPAPRFVAPARTAAR